MVVLNQSIKTIGLIPVEIQLHSEVKVDVIINIARSKEEAEIQAETGRALVSDALEAHQEEVLAEIEAEANAETTEAEVATEEKDA